MLHNREDFRVLKECYKWAWVLNYGTAFYETQRYQDFTHFYYLRSTPDSAAPLDHPPAIALPPRLFIDLVCGGESQAPVLEKIRRAAQTFENCWRDLSDCPGLSLGEIVLYHDRRQGRMGVAARETAVLGE
ncbi:MAG: hypothetical protein VKN60_06045 [Cyanobacteriota bacterium]|nr:hypothetical protein [Cyanobacteriota bacterium]